jgi:hypothetical protein
MGRLLVAVDPSIGVGAGAFAEVWNGDESAARWGPARVEAGRGEVMLPGLVEWVMVPVAVGLVSSALYDVVKRLVVRAAPRVDVSEVEVVEVASAQGDRVVVVRSRRVRS